MNLDAMSQEELARLDPEWLAVKLGVSCAEAREIRSDAIREIMFPTSNASKKAAHNLFGKGSA